MSILLADTAHTAATQAAGTLAPPPATQPNDPQVSSLVLGAFVAWLVLGVLVARSAGAFRRRSIIGPERLSPRDSAWVLASVFFGSYFMASAAALLAAPHLHIRDDAKPLLVGLIVYTVAVALAGLSLNNILRGGLRTFGLSARRLLSGVGIGALTLFTLYPLVSVVGDLTGMVILWFHLPKPDEHPILKSLGEWHDPRLIGLGIFTAVVAAPIAEEFAFRGVLQTSLTRLFGGASSPSAPARWLAVLITAAAFAAVHGELAFVPPLFVLAIGLGYVYERTGNLWATMTAHALFNAIQIVFFLGMRAG